MSQLELKVNFQIAFLEVNRKFKQFCLYFPQASQSEKLARVEQFIEEEGLTGRLPSREFLEKIEALPTVFDQVKEFVENLYKELQK